MSFKDVRSMVGLFSTEWQVEGPRVPGRDCSELVVTLPRYSPSSDVTTIDPDQPQSASGLESPAEEAGGRSSSQRYDTPQSLDVTCQDVVEFSGNETAVVVYQPKVNPVIESKISQLMETALSQEETRDYASAIISYTKAINLRSNDVVCLVRRAECYLCIADLQSAILGYRKTCLLVPNDAVSCRRLAFLYYLNGQCLFEQKLYNYALESFEKAKNVDKHNPWFQYRSMVCLAALNRLPECLSMVSQHLTERLPPSDDVASKNITTDIYVLRARIHAKLGNTALCYYDVRDALLLDESHREAKKILQILEEKAVDLKNQSIRLTLTGRNREACQRLTTAIDTDPLNAELHVHRGIVLRHSKNYNSAIDDFLLAVDKAENGAKGDVRTKAQRQLLLAYNDFAVDCCRKNFFEEAIVLLNRAIGEERSEKGLYLNRGDCFFRLGNVPFALADYMQALEMDPTDAVICERIAEIHAYRANVLFEARKYYEAEIKISLAIKYNPLSSSFYALRSKARELLQTVYEAQTDSIRALSIDPGNTEILSLMTRLFPGQSVRDVMSSPLAKELKEELEKISSHRKPQNSKMRFSSFSASDDVFALVNLKENEKPRLETVTKISSKSNLHRSKDKTSSDINISNEKNFHLCLVKEKKKMNSLIHRALHGSRSLVNYQRSLSTKTSAVEITANQSIPCRPLAVASDQQLPTNRWQKLRRLNQIS